MSKQDIQIVIVDDSKGEKCDAECGVDWSLAESIALASQQIKDRFGYQIKLEFIDLSQPEANPLAPELSEKVKNKNLSLPLLLINGQSRISGYFDIRQLLDAIEAEIELGA